MLWASYVLATLVGVKPLIDIFWMARVSLGSHSINAQGLCALVIAVGGVVCALVVLVRRNVGADPTLRRLALLTLAFTALAGLRVLMMPGNQELVVKYWAGLAGTFALIVLWRRYASAQGFSPPRLLGGLIIASSAIIWVGGVIQLMGLIPYRHTDFSPQFGYFMNMTGFFFHPLDFARIALWSLFAIYVVLLFRTRPGALAWIALFVFSALFLRVSHRMSLLLSLIAPLVLAQSNGRWKRASVVLLLIIAGWTSWFLMPESPNFSAIFGSYHFAPDFDPNKFSHFGRGRVEIWIQHFGFIASDYKVGNFFLGSPLDYAQIEARGICPEPHNQFLDLFQLFGLVGLAIVSAFWVLVFRLGEAPVGWRRLLLLVLLGYAATAQPLLMPTFAWLFAYFLVYPKKAWFRDA